jgi:hypothetical protein
MYIQKSVCDKKEFEFDEEKKKLNTLKEEVLRVLVHHEMDKYVVPYGTINITNRFTVSMPKLEEARNAFFDYLKTMGIFESIITVHSQTLNAFYKSKMEEAINEGNVDFKIPGIAEPKLVQNLTIRAK